MASVWLIILQMACFANTELHILAVFPVTTKTSPVQQVLKHLVEAAPSSQEGVAR